MNYRELLNRTIKRSGLKNVELIAKLKDEGVSITPNYLSVLRNDDTKIASNELSIAIAKVCGAPEELLIVQADLDRLSGPLKKYIEYTFDSTFKGARFISSFLPLDEKNKVNSKMDEWCIADYIVDFINNPDDYTGASDDFLGAINQALNAKQKYAIVPIAPNQEVTITDDLKNVK